MKKYEKYINNEILENITNQFENIFGVVSNPHFENEYGKCVGQIVLAIKLKNKVNLSLGDIVEFKESKIKWRSSYPDDHGRIICLLDPHWVKQHKINIRIDVPVKVQKTIVKEVDGQIEKEYFIETEYQKMNRNQFIKRKMIEYLRDYKYYEIEAVNNLNARYSEHKDYYRAVNETSKNYVIPSDYLISLRGKINSIKKKILSEWMNLELSYFKNKNAQTDMDELYKLLEKESSNVVQFPSLKP